MCSFSLEVPSFKNVSHIFATEKSLAATRKEKDLKSQQIGFSGCAVFVVFVLYVGLEWICSGMYR